MDIKHKIGKETHLCRKLVIGGILLYIINLTIVSSFDLGGSLCSAVLFMVSIAPIYAACIIFSIKTYREHKFRSIFIMIVSSHVVWTGFSKFIIELL